ncbi:MAG: carboxylating nicotinate-nucleotide diphosphorylase [Candidatus Thorarchaeota archaeon]
MTPNKLGSITEIPSQLILHKFYEMLDEDIGFGDITTTALIPTNQPAHARLFTRQTGIVAGISIATTILENFNCIVTQKTSDGTQVKPNTTLLLVKGRATNLLTIERTLLNLLQRMSGIATATANLVKLAQKSNSAVRVAATRKTAPLLRLFDKLAVIIGGGDPHRWRLDDAILIKDNHLAFYSNPVKAVQQARKNSSFTTPIEIEVTTTADAIRVAEANPDIILLDNMSPREVTEVVQKLRQTHHSIILEVSGNITADNIQSYAATGVDVISVGWLTHSVPALDLSIDITPTRKKVSTGR